MSFLQLSQVEFYDRRPTMKDRDAFSAWLEAPVVDERHWRQCEIMGYYLNACLECFLWVYQEFGSPKWPGRSEFPHLDWSITAQQAGRWLKLDGRRIGRSLLNLFHQMDRLDRLDQLSNVHTATLQFAYIVYELFIKAAKAHSEGKSRNVVLVNGVLVNGVANSDGIRYTDLFCVH
jgi:hypothetical protein